MTRFGMDTGGADELQRAAADGGRARVRSGRADGQQAAAGLVERAGAVDGLAFSVPAVVWLKVTVALLAKVIERGEGWPPWPPACRC